MSCSPHVCMSHSRPPFSFLCTSIYSLMLLKCIESVNNTYIVYITYERIFPWSSMEFAFYIIISRVHVIIDGVSDWILDLFTTYIHDFVLHAVTAPSQITIPPAMPFPAFYVFTSRSLVTASNNGDFSALTRAGPLWTAAPFQLSLFLIDSRTELTLLPQLSCLQPLCTDLVVNTVPNSTSIAVTFAYLAAFA
jgi:hypothetical protein